MACIAAAFLVVPRDFFWDHAAAPAVLRGLQQLAVNLRKYQMRISASGSLVILGFAVLALSLTPARAGKTTPLKADPYAGAIVVDLATGKTLFESNSDAQGYPASIIKLMDLLIILEKAKEGSLKFSDKVTVTRDSSAVGGSQVWLKEGEVFTIDDLLYALMVRSANDAATALAIHVAGSKGAFVELMNKKAKELGMNSTQFISVHGLPPPSGQRPDVSTPRDLVLLAKELLKHKDTLRYTSTLKRPFREGSKAQVDMENHNHLLGSLQGCDGLKTGYFSNAGFSIVATAERNGRRVIAVVLGSISRPVRDEATKELLAKGFLNLPPLPPPPPVVTNAVPTNVVANVEKRAASPGLPWNWKKIGLGLGIAILVVGAVSWVVARRTSRLDFH
ncbi:MAG: D-alanyl-D-alanine carboxypeptidase [Verrucomicrobia bacterium]|nr:D-alanyl-D-alanine carboxypeptidase [Verrucomicrobiota bacterium]